MQPNDTRHELRRRIRRLELAFIVAGIFGTLMITGCLVGASGAGDHRDDGLLRVRGLIVEDAQGRPRLVLGSDLGTVQGRQRTDAVSGLILLSPDGRDILQLGRVGGPQMGGKVMPRMSPATGLAVADSAGDERAGFGLFDNGQAGWGLDFPDGEGLVALVDPVRKLSGLVLQAPGDGQNQRALLLQSPEGTNLELSDGEGRRRLRLRIASGSEPALEVLDADGQVVFDALVSR